MKLIRQFRTLQLQTIYKQIAKRSTYYRLRKLSHGIAGEERSPSLSKNSSPCSSNQLPSGSLLPQVKLAQRNYFPSPYIVQPLTTDNLLVKTCSKFCPSKKKNNLLSLISSAHFHNFTTMNNQRNPVGFITGQKYRKFGNFNDIIYKLRLFCRNRVEKASPNPAQMKMNIVTDNCAPGKTRQEIYPAIQDAQERTTPMQEDVDSCSMKKKLMCIRKTAVEPKPCEMPPPPCSLREPYEPEVVCPEPPSLKDCMSLPYYFKKVCVKTENGRCIKYELRRFPMPKLIKRASCKDIKAPCRSACLKQQPNSSDSLSTIINVCLGTSNQNSKNLSVCNPCNKMPAERSTSAPSVLYEPIKPVCDPCKKPDHCGKYAPKSFPKTTPIGEPCKKDPCKAQSSPICDPCKAIPNNVLVCDPCQKKNPCDAADPCKALPKNTPVCDPCQKTSPCDTAPPKPSLKAASDPCKKRDSCGIVHSKPPLTYDRCKSAHKTASICNPCQKKSEPKPSSIGSASKKPPGKAALPKAALVSGPCQPQPKTSPPCDPCKKINPCTTATVCDPCKKQDPCKSRPKTTCKEKSPCKVATPSSVCDPCKKQDPCSPPAKPTSASSLCKKKDPCKDRLTIKPSSSSVCDPCKKPDTCKPRSQSVSVCDPCKSQPTTSPRDLSKAASPKPSFICNKKDPCKGPCPKSASVSDSCKKSDPCQPKATTTPPCKEIDPCSIDDPCKSAPKTTTSSPCKKEDPCKVGAPRPCPSDPCKKQDPCKARPKPTDGPCKREDPCKVATSKHSSGDLCKKEDPCKVATPKPCPSDPCMKQDPCKSRPKTTDGPCKKEDPCKVATPKPCPSDPCMKQDPCKPRPKTTDGPCKKEDPCKVVTLKPCPSDPCKKQDPCKPRPKTTDGPCKKEDPCKVATPKPCPSDPCMKQDPCKPRPKTTDGRCKKEDPCKVATPKPCPSDPCKKQDPCKARPKTTSGVCKRQDSCKQAPPKQVSGLCEIKDGKRPCPICYRKMASDKKNDPCPKDRCKVKKGERPCPICYRKAPGACEKSSGCNKEPPDKPSGTDGSSQKKNSTTKCNSARLIVPYRCKHTRCVPTKSALFKRQASRYSCGPDCPHNEPCACSQQANKANSCSCGENCTCSQKPEASECPCGKECTCTKPCMCSAPKETTCAQGACAGSPKVRSANFDTRKLCKNSVSKGHKVKVVSANFNVVELREKAIKKMKPKSGSPKKCKSKTNKSKRSCSETSICDKSKSKSGSKNYHTTSRRLLPEGKNQNVVRFPHRDLHGELDQLQSDSSEKE